MYALLCAIFAFVGKVPVLVHKGEVYYESMITCQYVDEIFPGPKISRKDPGSRKI
jgi:glutathione S-transferase